MGIRRLVGWMVIRWILIILLTKCGKYDGRNKKMHEVQYRKNNLSIWHDQRKRGRIKIVVQDLLVSL